MYMSMKSNRRYTFLLAAAVITFFSACSDQSNTTQKPNIVWITSEDNSIHYMDMYAEGGAPTPNIAGLAEHGLLFNHAFSNAPVCSAARSALISGCYGPRIGSNYHRKIKPVPMPGDLEMFPRYLRRAGYYTTNNAKEDYNIVRSDSVWDESSRKATWKNRKDGQPFFHVFNIGVTHEGGLHFTEEQMKARGTRTDTGSFSTLPVHPDTELFRYTGALYRDRITEMDSIVGRVVNEIRDAGLMDNTFIFYFGDHGGVLPGSKGYLYETGLHVPLVIHIPGKYKELAGMAPGSAVEGFVSFIDFAPTVLSLAGIEIPAGMDGTPFLGKAITGEQVESRELTFGYADRFDEKYDMVRSCRKGPYKYIRSYQPFNFDGLMNNYRYLQLAYRQWLKLYNEGALNELQARFFETRPPELLFDVENDPYETTNLAEDPAYAATLSEMRETLDDWVTQMPDLSFYPEHFLVANAFKNPVEFGRSHKAQIHKYSDIANLQLAGFHSAKQAILHALENTDPWQRYWGLIVCSSYAENDADLVQKAMEIAGNDPEPVNRTRAAEFLGLTGVVHPGDVMTRALYNSRSGAEALLILNSIVLMEDGPMKYTIEIDPKRIPGEIRKNSEVKRRLEYLL